MLVILNLAKRTVTHVCGSTGYSSKADYCPMCRTNINNSCSVIMAVTCQRLTSVLCPPVAGRYKKRKIGRKNKSQYDTIISDLMNEMKGKDISTVMEYHFYSIFICYISLH